MATEDEDDIPDIPARLPTSDTIGFLCATRLIRMKRDAPEGFVLM